MDTAREANADTYRRFCERGAKPYLRRKRPRANPCLALFALLVHDIFGAHGFIAMRRTQKGNRRDSQSNRQINTENKSLTDQVNSPQNDPKASNA